MADDDQLGHRDMDQPTRYPYSPPPGSELSDHTPDTAQAMTGPIVATRHQWQEYHQFEQLLDQTDALCEKNAAKRIEVGETVRAVHDGALTLRVNLRSRLRFMEGNSPSRYQTRFDKIVQDYNAIDAAYTGNNSQLFFDHAISFEIGSPSARSNLPDEIARAPRFI